MKIVFMGTATFSQAVLEKLIENNYPISLVVTQPDRLVGRKKQFKMPEVKEVALKYGIEVFQPSKLSKDNQPIIDINPDLIITAAYGQMVPSKVLNVPRLGCINVHASLLPLYRGGAPVHKAIIDGQEETGVTIMYMEKKMDSGNIIAQRKTPITKQDNVGILYDRLSHIGAELLIDTLPSIIDGTNESIEQDESLVTYANVISHEDEKLDFCQTSFQVDCFVRGLCPWPVAYALYDDKTIKIWAGHMVDYQGDEKPGTIVSITKNNIIVKTTDGAYAIDEIQVAGKKRMSVRDYLNGKSIFVTLTCFQ